MKSKIRVEYDFDKKEPYLQLFLEVPEEDLADRTLKHFIEEGSKNGFEVIHPKNNENNNVPQIRVIMPSPQDQECPSITVQNVSPLFIRFLTEKNITFEQYPTFVTVSYFAELSLFEYGMMWGQYYSENSPRP